MTYIAATIAFTVSFITTALFILHHNKPNRKKYLTIKVKRLGWVGLWQTSIHLGHAFHITWSMIKEFDMSINLLGIIIPNKYGGTHRSLFSFRCFRFTDKCKPLKAAYLTFNIFYLPHLRFRIGNGNTWWWIRNDNLYFYRIRKNNYMPF